jgi:PAS domain S-box-containing protein
VASRLLSTPPPSVKVVASIPNALGQNHDRPPIEKLLSELKSARDEANFSRSLLQTIGNVTPDLIYAKDRSGRMTYANPAVLNAVGRSWDDIAGRLDTEWHADAAEAQRFVDNDARIMSAGVTETLEENLTGPDGVRTYLSTKGPLKDADGEVVGLFGISVDITARKKAEAQARFLMQEMNHRVKNTLAVVQAMARQTLKAASVDRAAWDAFEARLIAMARAHDALTRDSWSGAEVGVIVAEALEMHDPARVRRFDVDGPAVMLDAQTALALSMALHELGTNALKYGALSTPEGHVAIRWQVDTDARGRVLDLRWNENGGPRVVAPSRRGFGSRLIEQAFSQLDADSARVEYLPQGVEFRLRAVLPPDFAAA